MVDESGWRKQGQHSVGVRHQYCGAVGKQANCQVSVEVVVCDGGGCPSRAAYLPQIGRKMLSDAPRWECPPGCDSRPSRSWGWTCSGKLRPTAFRPRPSWATPCTGIVPTSGRESASWGWSLCCGAPTHKAWTQAVPTQRKRTRHYAAGCPSSGSDPGRDRARFPPQQWKNCSWKAADGQTRRTRLAWCEVHLQHRLRQGKEELEKVWLVVDWPSGDKEPYHYYLAHFHRPPGRARCLKLSRSRWHVEQYFQRSKDDLGLDHFEGRSWRGFHHHLALSALAYLFILTQYLRTKKNFWCDVGTDPASDPALAGEGERLLHLLRNEI